MQWTIVEKRNFHIHNAIEEVDCKKVGIYFASAYMRLQKTDLGFIK